MHRHGEDAAHDASTAARSEAAALEHASAQLCFRDFTKHVRKAWRSPKGARGARSGLTRTAGCAATVASPSRAPMAKLQRRPGGLVTVPILGRARSPAASAVRGLLVVAFMATRKLYTQRLEALGAHVDERTAEAEPCDPRKEPS
jgi:hypothetical protein